MQKLVLIIHPALLVWCDDKHLICISYNMVYQVLDTNKPLVKWWQGPYPLLPITTISPPVWVVWIQPSIVLIFWCLSFSWLNCLLFPSSNHPMRDTIQWICLDNKIFIEQNYKVTNFFYTNEVQLLPCLVFLGYSWSLIQFTLFINISNGVVDFYPVLTVLFICLLIFFSISCTILMFTNFYCNIQTYQISHPIDLVPPYLQYYP